MRSSSYADPVFLALFYEWLDELIFHDPREGLRWAKVAPQLAFNSPVWPEGRQAHRERIHMAFVVLGSAYRACGDFDASEDVYGKALKQKNVSALLRADADRRFSYLRASQGRADEALELASNAVEALRGLTDDVLIKLGQALISKGYVLASELGRRTEAIDLFCEALALAGKPKTPAEERLHESACHNLALAIHESSAFSGQQKALGYCQHARELLKGRKRSAARYRLLWVEALIWSNLGSHAKAERLMRQSLEGFQVLKMPWEIALVGLDLAALHHLCGEWHKVKEVAADTYQWFRLLAADTKAIAALSLWNDAVKAELWEEAKLGKARQTILLRMSRTKRQPGKKR